MKRTKYFRLGDLIALSTDCKFGFWPNYNKGPKRICRFMMNRRSYYLGFDDKYESFEQICVANITNQYPEFCSKELFLALNDLAVDLDKINSVNPKTAFIALKRFEKMIKVERSWQKKLIDGHYGIKFHKQYAITSFS